jgi:hypothetical protein
MVVNADADLFIDCMQPPGPMLAGLDHRRRPHAEPYSNFPERQDNLYATWCWKLQRIGDMRPTFVYDTTARPSLMTCSGFPRCLRDRAARRWCQICSTQCGGGLRVH